MHLAVGTIRHVPTFGATESATPCPRSQLSIAHIVDLFLSVHWMLVKESMCLQRAKVVQRE
jgi:hypothetical protein